jgi:hypothetical protein
MKTFLTALVIFIFIVGCNSSKTTLKSTESTQEQPYRIANDSLEYEIIIFDLGFETYLQTIARPANFYTQQYYENKNRLYVTEWNLRAQNPLRYNNQIFENRIDYDFNTNYGLDVNYKLYNYFKFVEYKYKIKIL